MPEDRTWCFFVAVWWLAATIATGGEQGTSQRPPVGGSYPVPKTLLISNTPGRYDEGRSRMMNLLDGMGLDFDLLGSDKASTADFADYQLVIVAPTSDREFKVDESCLTTPGYTYASNIVGIILGRPGQMS